MIDGTGRKRAPALVIWGSNSAPPRNVALYPRSTRWEAMLIMGVAWPVTGEVQIRRRGLGVVLAREERPLVTLLATPLAEESAVMTMMKDVRDEVE